MGFLIVKYLNTHTIALQNWYDLKKIVVMIHRITVWMMHVNDWAELLGRLHEKLGRMVQTNLPNIKFVK